MTFLLKHLMRTSLVLFALFSIQAHAQSITFSETTDFPKAAAGSYGILINAVSSGQLIVWNGNTIYRQTLPGGNTFVPIASGYAGDPGFLAVAPDGHTLVLGAGYSGKVYVVDSDAPLSYTPGSEVATIPHYSGTYLTQTKVLLDCGVYPYAELGILDLTTGIYRAVMYKPSTADIDASPGSFAASAHVAVDPTHSTVYTSGLVYDAGFSVVRNELKRISASSLLAAYASSSMLNWNTDATLIGNNGDFEDGGPSAVTANGDILIGGFGGVQRVNPVSGMVTATYQPRGFDYYGVGYNIHRDTIYPIVADLDWSMDVVYARQNELSELPVTSAAGQVVLTVALALLLAGAVRKRNARLISE